MADDATAESPPQILRWSRWSNQLVLEAQKGRSMPMENKAMGLFFFFSARITVKKDGRDRESKMPIYRHWYWQQSRLIKASKDQRPEISRKANGGCSRSPRSNDQDSPH